MIHCEGIADVVAVKHFIASAGQRHPSQDQTILVLVTVRAAWHASNRISKANHYLRLLCHEIAAGSLPGYSVLVVEKQPVMAKYQSFILNNWAQREEFAFIRDCNICWYSLVHGQQQPEISQITQAALVVSSLIWRLPATWLAYRRLKYAFDSRYSVMLIRSNVQSSFGRFRDCGESYRPVIC